MGNVLMLSSTSEVVDLLLVKRGDYDVKRRFQGDQDLVSTSVCDNSTGHSVGYV